jgi:hypothetical protein
VFRTERAPVEDALSRAIADYWGAFSRSAHDPNPLEASRPRWAAFGESRNYLVLDTPITGAVDPPHHCDLWDEVGYLIIDPGALLSSSADADGPITRSP